MNSSAGPYGPRGGRRMAWPVRLLMAMGHAGLLSLSGLPHATAAATPERLLVWARAGLTDQDLGKGLAPYRVARKRLGSQGWHLVTVPAGLRAADMQQRLRGHPMFQHVEVDRLHSLSQALNDTFAGSLWHLDRLSVPPAWAVASGMGKGVTVAVLDTGVQADHPDLAGVLVPGWNVAESSVNTSDGHGHGTSVVGLLAAKINNGQGVAGLASGARVMPIRVTQPDGNARTSDIAMGLQRAAEQGARIANISFEGVMGSTIIRSAAQALYRKGGLVVVAAGNRGQEESHTAQAGMLVVGAVDERDARPAWASFGAHLSLSAPGDGLWTTGVGSGYRVVWGTSFAAPLVSAVVALMWEAAPQATPAQIEQWLRETAVDLGAPGADSQYGSGRLNAAAAVAAARRWHDAQAGAPGGSAGNATTTVAVQGSGTPPAVGAPTPSSAMGAWLGMDVDSTALPAVARVQVWAGMRLLLTDNDPPFAFALNLTEHPRGILRLRVVGADSSGAEIGSAEVDIQNNHQSVTAGPVRLVASQSEAAAPARPGTGWTALRRSSNGKSRQ